MRKSFLVILFFLLLAGGTVFYFGWIQFSVPPSQYGVMQSKTGGVDPVLIRNGEFRWAWERLLPTNARIHKFSIEPVQLDIQLYESLQSSRLYSELTGIEGDFSYEVEASLSFMLDPQELPNLVLSRSIEDQEDLQAYLYLKSEEVQTFILTELKNRMDSGDSVFSAELSSDFSSLVQENFRELTNVQLQIRHLALPDLALYRRLQHLYDDYLEQLSLRFSPRITDTAEKTSELRHKMDELNMYGELLTKYPVLLEYLNLEASRAE